MRGHGFAGRRAGIAIWMAAAACCLLAGFAWYDALFGEDRADAPQQSAAAAPLPPAPDFHLAAQALPEAYKAALERPLFHPGRRPFAERSVIAAAAAAAAAKMTPPQAPPVPAQTVLLPPQGLTLRGTIVSGPFRSAIFERAAKRDYIRIEEGEKLDGWTLAKVTRSGILLRAGGQELALKLEPGLR
jgi:hypothetical protein